MNNKEMYKLKKILEQKHIDYNYCEDGTLSIRVCEVCEPVHSYMDWTNEPEEDYDNWNLELLDILRPFIDDGLLYLRDCDECCGCGDW